MFVKRYKIGLGSLKNFLGDSNQTPILSTEPELDILSYPITGMTLNIPITLNFGNLDQTSVIEREFVNKEVEDSINPIIDYEKIKYKPRTTLNDIIDTLTYKVILLNSPNFPTNCSMFDLGFNDDDIKFRRNKFTRSFLRLSFYDNNVTTNQRLLFSVTLFLKLYSDQLTPFNQTNAGLPIPVNNIPSEIRLYDSNVNPNTNSEGFNLYHFKEETLPKRLYMRASFNNAKDGKTTPLVNSPTPVTIDNLINVLHTEYELERDGDDNYIYKLSTNNTNIVTNNNDVTVNLYEIQVI
jgi:hypothetical protein